jgi:hypothetical protein
MTPITLEAAKKIATLFTNNSAIEVEVNSIATGSSYIVPVIPVSQVYLSSTPVNMADMQQQLGYPRLSVFCSRFVNQHREKFRSLSGTLAITVEIAVTADLVDLVENWMHYYVEAVSNILRKSAGDLGDGVFFPGTYQVDVQLAQTGGSGFLQLAQVTCELGVSRN